MKLPFCFRLTARRWHFHSGAVNKFVRSLIDVPSLVLEWRFPIRNAGALMVLTASGVVGGKGTCCGFCDQHGTLAQR